MRQHIASVHGNEKPFKCAICNHCFALKHNLTQHIKRVHEKKTKNQCKECDMTFATRDDLKCHTREVHVSNMDLNIKISKHNVQSDHEKKEIDSEKISNLGRVIGDSKLALPKNNNLIQSDARDLSLENSQDNQIWYDDEKSEPQFNQSRGSIFQQENTIKADETYHDNAESTKTEIGKILCSKILPNRNCHGNTSNEKSHDINLDKSFVTDKQLYH